MSRTTDRVGPRRLRRALLWSIGLRLAGLTVLAVCAAIGIRVSSAARIGAELLMLLPLATFATLLIRAYRTHRREGGLERRAALAAVVEDAIPMPVRRLSVHEAKLFTSFLRWITRRRFHGVGEGDVPIPYASGGALVMFALIYASAIETVVLAFVIPWPTVRAITLFLDLWGVYFAIALYASCVVRPHVALADGSLRLRRGALLDITIPAQRIADSRVERRFAAGKAAAVDADGCAVLPMGGQTTVVVELDEPVEFVRPLGKTATARGFRYYAQDPAAAVAALRSAAARPGGPHSIAVAPPALRLADHGE